MRLRNEPGQNDIYMKAYRGHDLPFIPQIRQQRPNILLFSLPHSPGLLVRPVLSVLIFHESFLTGPSLCLPMLQRKHSGKPILWLRVAVQPVIVDNRYGRISCRVEKWLSIQVASTIIEQGEFLRHREVGADPDMVRMGEGSAGVLL